MIATISADIVRSTSLYTEDLIGLGRRLREFLDNLGKEYPGFWARIVKGDTIECFVPEYQFSLRIAILIKLFVKIRTSYWECSELLQKYGIRFSIGIAEIKYASKADDIINGQAINLSGRNLDAISRRDDCFSAIEVDGLPQSVNGLLDSYLALASNLVDSYSAKQAEVVFYKLRGYKEIEIADKLRIYQSSVNTRSKKAQWGLLNTAIHDFEQLDLERICG